MSVSSFRVAGGSVRGTRHRHNDSNNQDSLHWETRGDVTVALVTDGCSSGLHNEVGAKLGARLFAEAFFAEWAEWERMSRQPVGNDAAEFLKRVHLRLFGLFLPVIEAMRGRSHETLLDWFLFTAVVAFLTPARTLIACFGDGVAALNGELRVLESQDNCPRYPMYGVMGDPEPVIACPGEILWDIPTAEVRTLLLGTDGVTDVIASEACTLPGTSALVGSLAQFWSDSRYFQNPDRVRRRLAQINRDCQRIDWEPQRVHKEHGLLPDDTTLVVLRRTPGEVVCVDRGREPDTLE